MQAEQVVEKILSDARAQADAIRKQAGEREAAEMAKVNEDLARFEQQTKTLAEKAAADERSQRLAVARMEAAKEYASAKASLLDEVFNQARQKLEKLPDNEYRELMARLMAAAVETGTEKVIAGKNDARIDAKLVADVNARLKDKGKLTLADEKHNFGGGFLLQRGRVRTNVSLTVLVEQARKDLEIEVAKDLFSNDADAGRSR
ncbi:MAG TPA: V-type ATP synthase subunit E [Sedimentisphaerales bacterium]|jgi:V/A-type H+-transporting ATPase subunit E|nr:V-type ATP synthase subunit E [Sedimentisphaerales bacterium]HNU30403.1 V-type ATP synthase subunit E [Sedimentisphaerales bacterium]